jgi:predicted Fe-Mo cluster-binding NifX family protein
VEIPLKETHHMFCMKQSKPAIILILMVTVMVVGWTAYQESTYQESISKPEKYFNDIMKTATAPPIRLSQKAPHPDFGKCTNCHSIIGNGGANPQNPAPVMKAATAPPIRPTQAAPHPDFGKCTNCHNMIPPPPPIRSFQNAPHPDWGGCTDCHDIIGGAKKVAATMLVASVAPPMGGVWLKPITKPTADRLGFDNVDGVLVSGVNQQSSAYKAGLRAGDIIQRIDNRKADSLPEALALISMKHPRDIVNFKVLHNGRQRKILVKIGGKSIAPPQQWPTHVAATSPPGNRIAVAATRRDLTAQVAPVFSRSTAFILYDPASRRFTSIGNPGVGTLTAGRTATSQLIKAGVGAVIVGNIGPASLRRLRTAGIQVNAGTSGTVQDAVNQYYGGALAKENIDAVPENPGGQRRANQPLSGKVAVAATGPTLESPVARSLGLAPYLIIYDLSTGQIRAVAKDPAPDQGTNAVQTAHLVVEQGASGVIAGNISPTSVRNLSTLGVFSFAGVSGSVAGAIGMYKNGKLQATTASTRGTAAGGQVAQRLTI